MKLLTDCNSPGKVDVIDERACFAWPNLLAPLGPDGAVFSACPLLSLGGDAETLWRGKEWEIK